MLIRRILLLGALTVAAPLTTATAAAQDDPTAPPATSTSDDGRTVTGAGRTLTVSQVDGLDPAGTSLQITGSGYDEGKGVYVSLCVVPPPGQVPSPCGGGEDREGASGASAWISSDPPSYAEGLTTPYAPGGAFDVTITVQAALTDSLDCRQVNCAIVTRNDHTRGSDRSQDLFVPVRFAADSAATTTTTAPATPTTTVATTTTTDPRSVAPALTVGDDGRSVADGTRSVSLSAAALAPGSSVTVDGRGFDPGTGVFVSLCAFGDGGVPGPCATGGDRSAWITASAPDGLDDRATDWSGDGFTVELRVDPQIDGSTDCRSVRCGIGTRADAADGADRRLDLFVPVEFTADAPDAPAGVDGEGTDQAVAPVEFAESAALVGESAAATGESDDDGSGLPVAVAGAGLALAVALAMLRNARRSR